MVTKRGAMRLSHELKGQNFKQILKSIPNYYHFIGQSVKTFWKSRNSLDGASG